MPSAPDQPRIIHHRPIEELADSLQNSWKSVCECTARFLREVYEFDLRQGYKEWGYMDTARSADALVLMARRSLSGRFRGIDESDGDSDTETRASAESPESSGSGHLVMVHVDESALCGKGGASDLPIKTVKRLLCDGPAVGIVEDGNGEPLSIGRS